MEGRALISLAVVVSCIATSVVLGLLFARHRSENRWPLLIGVLALVVVGPGSAILGMLESADHKCAEEPANQIIVAGGLLAWLTLSAFGATVIGRRGSVSAVGSAVLAAALFVVALVVLTPVLGLLVMGDCATMPARAS